MDRGAWSPSPWGCKRAGHDLGTQLNSEISTKSVDIRGMIGALKTIQTGLMPTAAVNMGITNKSFDVFEREIVEDIVMTRIPEDWTKESVF